MKVISKDDLYRTKFVATDNVGGRVSSELMMIQTLLIFHYGLTWWDGEPRAIHQLPDDVIIYVTEKGKLIRNTTNYESYRPLTIHDIMPNQYRSYR